MELKKNAKRFIFRLVFVILIVIVTPTFAQAPPGFDDDVDDETVADIDNSLFLLLALGMTTGIYFLNAKRKTKTS